ncbi:MAG: alpha/beta hydrolase [Gammaproteobacteria bacterium]
MSIASLLSACSAVDVLNAVTPSGSHELTSGIAYGSDPRQRLDVYRPAPAASSHPLVVFFYGGSWNRGDRRDYRFLGQALAARGMVVVVPDYRVYPQIVYPEFLHDSAAAVAWAVREAGAFGADPKRLYVMGHSAGAYNAAMLALDPRWLAGSGLSPQALAGWLGLAGPYDFLPIINPEVRPVFNHPDYPSGTQPIDHVSFAAPRTFLAAAASDDLVNPKRNTAQLARLLDEAGVDVERKLYSRVNHVTLASAFAWPLRWLAPVLDDVTAFIGTGERGD